MDARFIDDVSKGATTLGMSFPCGTNREKKEEKTTKNLLGVKTGVHLKAALTSLNIVFLPISRFKQR